MSFWDIYGSKIVIIIEGKVGVDVREAGPIGGGRHEGVDRWVVRGF